MTDSDHVAVVSIAVGALLVVLGIASYVLSDFASPTALIPTVFGVFVGVFGLRIRHVPERRKQSRYAIVALAILGIAGSARGLPDIVALLTGGEPESTIAATSQGLFILLSLVLLVAVAASVLEPRGSN